MKRFLAGLVFAALTFAAPAQAADYYWTEAEDAASVVAPFQVNTDANASGGQYIIVPVGATANNFSPTGPFVQYQVTVAAAGDYVLWGRGIMASVVTDSFFVSMNGGTEHVWSGVAPSWSWVKLMDASASPVVFSLTAGTHTISVRHRETGTQLDKLLLTNDLSFVPTGTGGTNTPPPPVTTGQASLSWQAPATSIQIDGYRVYFGTSPGVYNQALGSGLNAGNSLSFVVTGLTEGVTYYFAATSYGPSGESTTFSNEASLTIPVTPQPAPPPPTGLQAN